MPARVTLSAIGPDAAVCVGVGFCLALVRCLFPDGRRSQLDFWLDFFFVGAALLLAQGYAAGRAAAGELRWYHIAAAGAGAAAAGTLFGKPLSRLRKGVYRSLGQWLKLPAKRLHAALCRVYAQKTKKRRNKARKKPKKQLQTGQRVLYNSNVL